MFLAGTGVGVCTLFTAWSVAASSFVWCKQRTPLPLPPRNQSPPHYAVPQFLMHLLCGRVLFHNAGVGGEGDGVAQPAAHDEPLQWWLTPPHQLRAGHGWRVSVRSVCDLLRSN